MPPPFDPLDSLRPEYRKLYQFICSTIETTGRSPSYREMADVVKFNRSYISRMLLVLERTGLIRWTPGKARAILVRRFNDVRLAAEFRDGMVELRWGKETVRCTIEEWRELDSVVEQSAAEANDGALFAPMPTADD